MTNIKNIKIDRDEAPAVGFYADENTLREASTENLQFKVSTPQGSVQVTVGNEPEFYPFMQMLTPQSMLEFGDWVENCPVCKVPMIFTMLNGDAVVNGKLDKESASGIVWDHSTDTYKAWATWTDLEQIKSTINPSQKHWYCDQCCNIWTIITQAFDDNQKRKSGSFWVQVIVNGLKQFEIGKIKRVGKESPKPVNNDPIDPGVRTSERATKCPRCLVWRLIMPYNDKQEQHVCPRCHEVNIYPIGFIPIE